MLMRRSLNPVIALSIDGSKGRLKSARRFYFSAKPFFVAMLDAQNIDPEGGETLVQWRSDDPDGAQWRFASSEISFEFPPQAVGEEMERGNRFWDDAKKSTISVDRPIKYRFSRPTTISVRPSRVERRYNLVASDLREVLRRAEVQRFTTEMVYPLELSFARDAQHKPEVAISEAGQFFGAPSSNLPVLSRDEKQQSNRDTIAATFSSAIHNWLALKTEKQYDLLWATLAQVYRHVRASQAGFLATFVSRLGVFRLFDPFREDGGLRLSKGVTVAIRDRDSGAPPLFTPLPYDDKATGRPRVDLSTERKKDIAAFLTRKNPGDPDDWADKLIPDDYEARPVRAGILHTFEFPSELHAVLTDRTPATATIDTLALSALEPPAR